MVQFKKRSDKEAGRTRSISESKRDIFHIRWVGLRRDIQIDGLEVAGRSPEASKPTWTTTAPVMAAAAAPRRKGDQSTSKTLNPSGCF